MYELLLVKQRYEADIRAGEQGISSLTLMERAGEACCGILYERYPRAQNVCVLCGPGNNGGDGFVIARHLLDRGYNVRLGLLGCVEDLCGDSAIMAARWIGDVNDVSPEFPEGADVIVDAIFGTGLTRPVEGCLASLIESLNERLPVKQKVLAVDIASGVDGDSGFVRGVAIRADITVTFFRRMPGHFLFPGGLYCGEVVVVDIGIPEDVLTDICPFLFKNDPGWWCDIFPVPSPFGHKYDRGHAVIVSGDVLSTGAARLAAHGALRSGAGLVTLATPSSALAVNAAHLTAIMLACVDNPQDMEQILLDRRRNAVLLGPGNGVGELTKGKCVAALGSGATCVLDADALTSFTDMPLSLWAAIKENSHRDVVLTPHEGEFLVLFGDMGQKVSKVERAAIAAQLSGAVVILKGSDTVIASPDGRVAINNCAPATLATAGTGDVLAGIVCGLLAQGMRCFDAACAGVWIHSFSASRYGTGLIAEDLPEQIPYALKEILSSNREPLSLFSS